MRKIFLFVALLTSALSMAAVTADTLTVASGFKGNYDSISISVKSNTYECVGVRSNGKNTPTGFAGQQFIQLRAKAKSSDPGVIRASINGITSVVLYSKDTTKAIVKFDGIETAYCDTTPVDLVLKDTTIKGLKMTAKCEGASELEIINGNKTSYFTMIEVTYDKSMTPKKIKLDSIAIAGYKTSFRQYFDFEFGGTTTAYYSNKATIDVTSKASYSGYDLTQAGTQTVTVQFADKDTTVTAKYTIDVLPRETLDIVPTTELEDGQLYVITTTKSDAQYFMPAGEYASAPAAKPFKPAYVDSVDMWQLTQVGEQWKISSADGDSLYLLAANDGVRTSKDSAAFFTIDTGSVVGCYNLKALDADSAVRYMRMYNTQDWRCYTNNPSEIGFYRIRKAGEVIKPQISPDEPYFADSAVITMRAESGCTIYYTLDGTEPTTASSVYTDSIIIRESVTVKAIANKGGSSSPVLSVNYVKLQVDSIKIEDYTETLRQYHDFVFGGKVTAYYNNATAKDVSSKATFSGYDMSKSGKQQIEVAYTEYGATKKANYELTVTAKTEFIQVMPVAFGEIQDSAFYFVGATMKDTAYFLPAMSYTAKAAAKVQRLDSLQMEKDEMWQFVKIEGGWKLQTASQEGLYFLPETYGRALLSKADTAAVFTMAAGANADYVNLTASDGQEARQLVLYKNTDWRHYASLSSSVNGELQLYRLRLASDVMKPQISPKDTMFADSARIAMSADKGATIYYTLDGTTPTQSSKVYADTFVIKTKTTIKAIAMLGAYRSGVTEVTYYKRHLDSIVLSIKMDTLKQYSSFKYNGRVTAYYDYGKTKQVKSQSQFTGYDMDKNGKQTVTVSYTEDNITKTAQYTLFVEEKPVLPLVPITSFDVVDQTQFVITATVNDTMYYLPGATKDRSTTPAKVCDFKRLEETDMWKFIHTEKGWKIVDAEGRGLYYAPDKTDVGCKVDTASFFTIERGSDCRYVNLRSENATGERSLGVLANKYWRAYQKAPENATIDIRLYKIMEPGEVLRPIILPGDGKFSEPMKVQIYSEEKDMTIYYTLDGTTPTTASTRYTMEFEIKETTTVKAIAAKGDAMSQVTTAVYEYEPISGIGVVKSADCRTNRTMKYMENGRVIIVRDGIKYTLLGEKM